jgi:hypothetical protein
MKPPSADYLRAKLNRFINQRLDFYLKPDAWLQKRLIEIFKKF